jgi:hypothetical protein
MGITGRARLCAATKGAREMADDALLHTSDPAYLDRMSAAVFRAVLEAGKLPDQPKVVLKNGEIVKALLMTAAVFAATSASAATPEQRAALCDKIAGRLRGYIDEARVVFDAGAFDWLSVIGGID